MKFWITKYALTDGDVEEIEGEAVDSHVTGQKYALRGAYGAKDYIFARIGFDAFRTREEAVARVRTKVAAKLNALKKQQARLEKILADLK